MITSKYHWKYACFCVASNDTSNGSCDPRDSTRVLQLANGRVVQVIVLFKLMVAMKYDLPAQLLKLVGQACLDQMNWALINTCFRLDRIEPDWTIRIPDAFTCPPLKKFLRP